MNWKRIIVLACAVIVSGAALDCKDPLSTGDPHNEVVATTVFLEASTYPATPIVPVGSMGYITVIIHDTNLFSPAKIAVINITGLSSSLAIDSMNTKYPWVIAPGDSASFRLRFSPTSTGHFTVTVALNGDSNTQNTSVAFQAWGGSYSLQSLSDTIVNFGKVQANPNWPGDTTASPAQMVVLKNVGAPFSIYHALFAGDDPANFEVTYTPSYIPYHTIQTGEIDTFFVNFIPGSAGQFNATFDFQTDNFPLSQFPSIHLIGIGTADTSGFPNVGFPNGTHDTIQFNPTSSNTIDSVNYTVFNTSSSTEHIVGELISGIISGYGIPSSLDTIPAHGNYNIGLGWKGNPLSINDEDRATLKIIYATSASVQIPMIVK